MQVLGRTRAARRPFDEEAMKMAPGGGLAFIKR